MLSVRLVVTPILASALVLLGASVVQAQICRPAGHPHITEILYDAAGDDTGREFVELFNPLDVARSLAGARLEAGDGSGPGRWTLRWTGGASDSIGPHGRFVIGGALIGVTPQALATLELQNGPDAVRMVWPDGATEVVGYGALEFPEYACGAPAADVASGQSLARVPDDADAGSNALDFRAASPTPSRANQNRRDLSWLAGSARATPALVEVGAPVRVAAVLENRGSETLASGVGGWVLRAEAGDTLARGSSPRAMAAGDTVSVAAQVAALATGKHRWRFEASLQGDEAPENDDDSLWVRIGRGPLQLTEVQFHPTSGEGEWVEVINAREAPIELADFGFADRADHPGRPSAYTLAPESLAVFAQDRLALLARFPGLDSTRVLGLRPWPSLNNSNDDAGIADVASLLDADGVPSDRLAYSASGVPAGVPLERDRAGFWGPAAQIGGTPLAPPPLSAAVRGRFEIEPHRLLASGAEARLRWDLPWPRARVACDLYDLAGRPRGSVLPETLVPGRGERRWTPRDVSAGLYLVVLRAEAETGEGSLAVTRPVRLEAR